VTVPPFERSHLTVAKYMQFTGTEVAGVARVRRLIQSFEGYQQQTGVLLFQIKRGGAFRIAEDGTESYTATQYTDLLKPIADIAVMRARTSERWAKHPGYVFPSPRTGGRLIDIKHKFDEARTTAKIKDFRFHDLRHTAATRLADAGVNVVVIAEILGHADIRTTKRYSHAMEESKREAVEKLAESSLTSQNLVKTASKEKRQARQPAVNS
jgi:Phage integrase family